MCTMRIHAHFFVAELVDNGLWTSEESSSYRRLNNNAEEEEEEEEKKDSTKNMTNTKK